MTDLKALIKKYTAVFEEYAKARFKEKFTTEPTLFEAMKYSFFAGGKRVRPLLMLMTAKMLGVGEERVLPFAFALECIHTYSLIHDDLPAMDNDDYRRGKLTNHKVYGEATAILAGDALLNLAFSVAAHECVICPDTSTAKCAALLADHAGFEGMIGGQSADVLAEMSDVKDDKILYFIEENKTAKLIMASTLIPAILSGKGYDELQRFGRSLGVQFQIIDDILDEESTLGELGKSVGKDRRSGKLTYITAHGIDAAKDRAMQLYEDCLSALASFEGSGELAEFCRYLKDRIN